MFSHLHIHNEFSQLDGLGTADDYAKRANDLEMKYLALTNHGNVDGIIRWQKACKEHGIKPVFGCEFYIVPDISVKEKGEKRYHITILAKSNKGLESIMRMLTIANVDGFYYKPRIDFETLLNANDIVVMSACVQSFLLMGKGYIYHILNEFGNDNFYIELMPHIFDEQLKTNQLGLCLAEKYGIKTVATNDCHYPLEENSLTQEVLLAIQRKVKWDDPKRWKFEIEGLHLRTKDEMIQAFREQGQLTREQIYRSIKNTEEVAEACSFYIDQKKVYLPKIPGHEKRDEGKFLQQLIEKGLRERLLKPKIINELELDLYRERIEEEYNLICELNFQRYFLIVWELISWCRRNDIMVGPGRGSVGGSLVAYCLYITDVDPIKYGLIFARFISPARIDLPDIDMDFEDIKRHKVREHLEDLYGSNRVTSLSTFLRMKGKLAIRDVSRVFNVPIPEINKATKTIINTLEKNDNSIKIAFQTEEDGIEFKNKYPEVTKIAMDLEGQIKTSGKHAAAICISSDDFHSGKITNLVYRNKELISNWDKYDAEYMGLMKLDVLGLSALTILNHAKELIQENYNKYIEFNKIPLNDKKTLSEFNEGNTTGIFQLGTIGLKKFCTELEINKFEDIVHATALWRPGALGAGLTDEFVSRKHGRTETRYIHRLLMEKTQETYGIILYQEQVMWLMYELAGLDWKVCDEVRKIIGKSGGGEKFIAYGEQFIKGCKRKDTLSKNEAETLWESLSSFGNYGFNKAHAVGYSMITYWEMWCKVNYPKEFIVASLTYSNPDSKQDLIDETKRLGIEVYLPDLEKSDSIKWIADKDDNKIYCPFIEIKGVGEKTAEKILAQNNEGFFEKDKRKINKNVTEILKQIYLFNTNSGEVTEDEINEYFDFTVTKDPMNRYRKLHEMVFDPKILEYFYACHDDDLNSCSFDGLNLVLNSNIKFKNRKPLTCVKCELSAECTNPVLNSSGNTNIMILGEAPGRDEDRSGIGFIGRAGNKLWETLAKENLQREDFHITNVVKCYPSQSKTPKKKHIIACKIHLEKEIEKINPPLILALGNTCLKFFKNQDSGIMNLSGKTEWSQKYGCWICWCLHPASTLYDNSNDEKFFEGISNFADKIENITDLYDSE